MYIGVSKVLKIVSQLTFWGCQEKNTQYCANILNICGNKKEKNKMKDSI